MNVRLVVVQGRNAGMEIPVPVSQFIIGRDARAQLRPGSEQVSKLHCALIMRDDRLYVRDLKSTNGTFINNDRVQGEVVVKDGDLLRVGPLIFSLKVDVGTGAEVRPTAGDVDNQAVEWLLDSSADPGTKTAIITGGTSSSKGEAESVNAEADTKVDGLGLKKPETPVAPKRPRTATAEVAGDILEKLLTPTTRARKSR